jgi:glycosyltransferase involved in cell wall biosynthesis
MVSVIIAAYNEENVIDGCLEALRKQHQVQELQIIVSANGCIDRTAEVAAMHGATVIDRNEPGKAGALNAAEDVATSFPRIYLDADITIPAHAVAELISALEQSPKLLAAVPRRRVNTIGRPLFVRSYFAINERLPAFRKGLFGRGVIALSEVGRRRFESFPPLIADDLFLDSQFSDDEKVEVPCVEVLVEAPHTTADLLARLIRVRRGNTEMRAAGATGEVAISVRPSDRWAWLREVVAPDPRLIIPAVPYLGLTVLASLLARRTPAHRWGRDESTRALGHTR